MIRRREFIAGVGAAVMVPLVALAQSNEMRRIGILTPSAEDDAQGRLELTALRQGLDKLGWHDGKNLKITVKSGATDPTRITGLSVELANSAPEVILAVGGTGVAYLRPIAGSIPIVFVQVPDPVGQGFVTSLTHPGGTITGFTNYELSITGKWLQLLKQIAPGVTQVGVLLDPTNNSNALYLSALEKAAPSVGVTLVELPARDDAEIDNAIVVFAGEAGRGVFVLPSPSSVPHRVRITAAIQRVSLPAMYWDRSFATLGGLASYGVDIADNYRRAADYIDRILKGEKAGDLPVQAPTKYDLTINLKTAKALGLTVPQSLLVAADQVIE